MELRLRQLELEDHSCVVCIRPSLSGNETCCTPFEPFGEPQVGTGIPTPIP